MGQKAPGTEIVRAAIYPAIGIARVGNSKTEFFIGPEVPRRENKPASFYKDPSGALKRQAARFKVYGLDAAGRVVRELTATEAKITWRVQVANKKAGWYEFITAMDVPQAVPTPLRNPNVTDRASLRITPPEVKIHGLNERGSKYAFDKGKFMGTPVYLGELQTDEKGRLIFLGGYGISKSAYPNNPPTTFANNEGWHDDTSDGPVDAEVVYNGKNLDVTGAWVVTAPPNYAPDVISVQTMYDLIYDTLSGGANGIGNAQYIVPKEKPSFKDDIYPLLHQFVDSQWVNKGFFAAYGKGQAYDFENPSTIHKLSFIPENGDPYQENRRQIFNYFRDPNDKNISQIAWPWMYGDNVSIPAQAPNAFLSVTPTLYQYLSQWAAGDFVQDWVADAPEPSCIEDIADAQLQADTLTKTALWYCLGGPFHPGCEMTWPMRMAGMYNGPFRIRRRSANNPEPVQLPMLSPEGFQNGNSSNTPLPEFWNAPGDLTRYMAVPWQTDTASCRSGYDPDFDPYLPTFWPARVPNTVLAEADYQVVMDTTQDQQTRLDAYNRRVVWYRTLGINYLDQIDNMVKHYGDLGVIGYAPGPDDLPDVPATLYVESPPFAAGGAPMTAAKRAAATPESTERARLAAEAAKVPGDRGLTTNPSIKFRKRK